MQTFIKSLEPRISINCFASVENILTAGLSALLLAKVTQSFKNAYNKNFWFMFIVKRKGRILAKFLLNMCFNGMGEPANMIAKLKLQPLPFAGAVLPIAGVLIQSNTSRRALPCTVS